MSSALYAGAARRDITPPIGTHLYGYHPGLVSTEIHDGLNITAIAFTDPATQNTALLLTATVCEIQTELDEELRGDAAKLCGIPAENILLSATHTHCGPNVAGTDGWGEIDRTYVESVFRPALLEAAKAAMDSRRPAVIGIGAGESKVGINRRQLLRDGSITFGQNPWGCYDPNMTILSIRDAETGVGILNMIHYGCHGTSAGTCSIISRDWSGIMCDRLEEETGTLSAFWDGAQGDVGPRLSNGGTVGDISLTEELGKQAAEDALRIYASIREYRFLPLTVRQDNIHLPYRPLPDRNKVKEILLSLPNPDELVNIDRLRAMYWHQTDELLARQDVIHPTLLTLPQTVVALDEIALIPFPYELFSSIVLRIREHSPFAHTLCLTNTNGYRYYFPSRDQMCLGGYEVECFLYGSPYTLTDDADQYLLEETLRNLEQFS